MDNTLRRPDENRAAHRARLSQQRTAAKPRIDDARERVLDDLTTFTLHPTKGFRRISGRRIEAIDAMPKWRIMWGMWSKQNLRQMA